MREELVTPARARRLAHAGLNWEPQIGDWCSVMGGVHLTETQTGLWLVVNVAQANGVIAFVDADGRWPISQAPIRDCLWLPNAGKLKMWLRSKGNRVATGETYTQLLGGSSPILHGVCRITPSGAGATPLDFEGMNEVEAVAAAVLHVLGADTAAPPGPFS
jgi:hypothetical protein